MSTVLDTVHDVFTHLCDCSLNRKPRAWRWQNPDPHRLRFLRWIVKEAGFVELLANRPTLLAEDWLHQTASEQLAVLADMWIAQNDTSAREKCLKEILSLEQGTSLTPVELTGRNSLTWQRRLWLPLVRLGYLAVEDDQAESPLLSVAPIPQPADVVPAWTIADLIVLAEPPYNWADLWALEHIAVLQELGPPRQYLLTDRHTAARHTLDYRPAAAVDLLEKTTGEALPKTVLDFFKPYADILVQQGAIITFTTADQLATLRKSLAWRRRLNQVLSPVHVWISTDEVPLVVDALQRLGLAVQVQASPASAASTRPTWQDNDQLRLLLAARVMNNLAEELGLLAALDEWTLSRLTAQLPPNRQRRLERLAAEHVQQIRQRLPEPVSTASKQPEEQILDIICQAIDEGRVIQIHYQPPPPRLLITRPIIPLQFESWGARTYVVATCLHHRAARTYRLDRIVHVEALEDPPPPG